jgi:hypothetical protein
MRGGWFRKREKRPDGLGELTGELVEDKERVEVPQLEPAWRGPNSIPRSANETKHKKMKKKNCHLLQLPLHGIGVIQPCLVPKDLYVI